MSLSLIIAALIIFHNINYGAINCNKKEEENNSKSINEWEKIKQYGKKINDKTRNNKNK